jgi:hypothetical protein
MILRASEVSDARAFFVPRAQMRRIDPIVNHAVQMICGPEGRRNAARDSMAKNGTVE